MRHSVIKRKQWGEGEREEVKEKKMKGKRRKKMNRKRECGKDMRVNGEIKKEKQG